MGILFIGNISFFRLDIAPRALRIYYRNREVPNNLGADGCWTRLAFQRLPIADRPQAPSGLKRDLLHVLPVVMERACCYIHDFGIGQRQF